jgi:hypothetical protein
LRNLGAALYGALQVRPPLPFPYVDLVPTLGVLAVRHALRHSLAANEPL